MNKEIKHLLEKDKEIKHLLEKERDYLFYIFEKLIEIEKAKAFESLNSPQFHLEQLRKTVEKIKEI